VLISFSSEEITSQISHQEEVNLVPLAVFNDPIAFSLT
jgi:hypothetical protein